MHVFTILMTFLIFGLSAPVAKADFMPEVLQGLWATPQCLTPNKMAYHSKTHVLYFTEDEAVADVSTMRKANPDYYVLENGRDVYPVQVFESGVLNIGILPEGRALDDRLLWEDLPLRTARRYVACENILPAPHDFAPAAFSAVDVMEGFCRIGSHETCLRAMFAFADRDASETVDMDEAVKLGLMALYLNPLLSYNPIGTRTFVNRLKYAEQTTPLFMQNVFKLVDADMSGDLTYDEIDYAGPLFIPALKDFAEYDAITKIMSIYPKLIEPSLR